MVRLNRAICTRCHITYAQQFEGDDELCDPCKDEMTWRSFESPIENKRLKKDDYIIRTTAEQKKIDKANAKWLLPKEPIDQKKLSKKLRYQQIKMSQSNILDESLSKHKQGIRKWNFI